MENHPAAAVRDLGGEMARPAPPAGRPAPQDTARARGEILEALAAPPREALPADIRNRLPALEMNIHAWAEAPDARFVLINLRRYREGDRLQEGPVVRRILSDGVVLEFEGTLFTLPRR